MIGSGSRGGAWTSALAVGATGRSSVAGTAVVALGEREGSSRAPATRMPATASASAIVETSHAVIRRPRGTRRAGAPRSVVTAVMLDGLPHGKSDVANDAERRVGGVAAGAWGPLPCSGAAMSCVEPYASA